MLDNIEFNEDETNPIDSVEEILSSHNWSFDRAGEDELTVDVAGKNSQYRIVFQWIEKFNALKFSCFCDIKIPDNNMIDAHAAVSSMNENLWLGHFDLPMKTRAPVFRYTSFLKSNERSSQSETIENIVDVSLLQCERFFPVFQLLSKNDIQIDHQVLSLALMETHGQS
ncbi:MAG: YbjN domain-containing protein [Micavibrio sp.]|nr:YbjN domain-containing protein [Micavibrio sp.]